MDLDITSVQALYLFRGKVLTRGVDGADYTLDPQPFLVRTYHVLRTENLEGAWPDILKTLQGVEPKQMLQLMASPDGPPYRAARLFYWGDNDNIYVPGTTVSLQSVPVLYPVGIANQPWDMDAHRLQPGLFVTGDGGPANIWKIHRIERDAWRGPLFTLAPLLLAPGFPVLDLSGIGNADRKQEIASHYDELQRCVLTHAYRGAIARAKDIAEALITEMSGRPPSDPFHIKLEDIYAQLKGGKHKLSWLTFTLCQKVRLLYKRTHPENALQEGRVLSPELALGVVQDLIEILRDLGHVKEKSAIGSM